MRTLTLAIWDVKRLIRHRASVAVLIGMPLIVALTRVALPRHQFTLVSAWVCPFACLLLTFGLLYIQRLTDQASGLLDGLRSTPLSPSQLKVSRLIMGFTLFALQMALFWGILAIRF
ncbi:MAG: hypothetical protein M1133_11550 [Armatimonadetes bacterium]|nr:hypothetical protein [Armatimonadota bacterium]